MRLTKIKLAGFKSFVDPTTIPIPSNLVGIIGPNGCGKSNAIDAVRWVMGESSAKNLRGDAMSDVIFNGSSTRKPVGQASVEMLFDNSEGRAGGQYHHYSEIAVKRLVNREGQSSYFLNGSKCRRRDITDLFLGTGLGPRSYSIIEQGMISRLIEARPEDLRTFLEEAAGISKYKERRRETENRIRHTRENLERLNDLRSELAKQIEHLKKQAKTAERFKVLKEQQRHTTGLLHTRHWQCLDKEYREVEQTVVEGETAIESIIAIQRNIEAEIAHLNEISHEKNEQINDIQKHYYAHGVEITRFEQKIQHISARTKQLQEAQQSQQHSEQALVAHLEADQQKIAILALSLAEHEQQKIEQIALSEAQSLQLAKAREDLRGWQSEWAFFHQRLHEPEKQLEWAQAQIQRQLETIKQHEEQLQCIAGELSTIDVDKLKQEVADQAQQQATQTAQIDVMQQQHDELQQSIHQQRDTNLEIAKQLDCQRNKTQQLNGQKSSLEALQQAALGGDDSAVNLWLEHSGLGNAQRLVQEISVTAGWEYAVEGVLGFFLESVCVDNLDSLATALNTLNSGSLTLFDTTTSLPQKNKITPALLDYVESKWSLQSLMGSVYTADNLDQALTLRHQLAPHESLITREGVWLGRAWLRIVHKSTENRGFLQREQQLGKLAIQLQQLEQQRGASEQQQQDGQDRLKTLEQRQELQQREYHKAYRALSETSKQLNKLESQWVQHGARSQQLKQQQLRFSEQRSSTIKAHKQASQQCKEASASIEQLSQQHEILTLKGQSLQLALETIEAHQQSIQTTNHDLALHIQSMQATKTAVEQGIARTKSQIAQLNEQQQKLSHEQQQLEDLEALKKALSEQLTLRATMESTLTNERSKAGEIESLLRENNTQRTQIEQALLARRNSLEKLRLTAQSLQGRREQLLEKINETGFAFPQLFDEVEEQGDEHELQQILASIERRIQRLGLINLAAIDEYQTNAERERYLGEQYQDLTDALATLESAIAKIDRETRARFKETFNKVNSGLQARFPKLFGGGHAYLELTGDDLLNTGVTIMARPPGKRNSTIHQLSGGEKALTAVALVFSIFELNPAPFCMLDEVDAPLDEANVGRFCKMVELMSEQVQFIFITHNKVTMEMAQQLNGVTMSEPGVSRLVAVDIKEAYELASQ